MAAGMPLLGRAAIRNQQISGMSDRRVRQQPLYVVLHQRAKVAESHGKRGHNPDQPTRPGAFASNMIRSNTANTAAFGAVDMNPTTGEGAPSYTSGVQT